MGFLLGDQATDTITVAGVIGVTDILATGSVTLEDAIIACWSCLTLQSFTWRSTCSCWVFQCRPAVSIGESFDPWSLAEHVVILLAGDT